MPCYYLLPKHVSQAYQQCKRTHFANRSGSVVQPRVAKKQRERTRKLVENGSIACLYRRFHNAKRCRGSLRVNVRSQLSSHRPRGHLRRERDQKEATANQSRIERIATQPAESHLADTDCNQRAYYHYPNRQVGRKIETKQQAGQYGRTVSYRRLPFQQIFCYRPLEEHARGHA